MLDGSNLLISLEERHAENIIRGTKLVELRRRRMNVPNGAIVWLYVKRPLAAVIGKGSVSEVYCLPPRELWRRFSTCTGLTRIEFFTYFSGVSRGCALELSNVERLTDPITLSELRKARTNFQPPQFFMKLQSDSTLLKKLASG
jgi:predicted transcriptional regulator